MANGPNWVYPDLVRIQSSSSFRNSNIQDLNNYLNDIKRSKERLSNPPDVSLLTSNSNNSPITLDLCCSLRPSTNVNKLNFGNSSISFSNSNNSKVNQKASNGSISSPGSSTGSGLVLTNSSNSSTSSLSNNLPPNALIPSTSNGITSREINRHLNENETKASRDVGSASDSNDISFIHNENSRLEEAITRQIQTSFNRFQSTLEASLNNLNNRLERLENRVTNISTQIVQNQSKIMNGGTEEDKGSSSNSHSTSNEQCWQQLQQLKLEQEQERRENRRKLINVLQYALEQLNSDEH